MPRVVVLVLLALLVAGGVLAVPTARSASPDVVVSQVYAGGGNSGAPFQHDFVELFNRGSTADRRQRLDDPVRVRGGHDLAGDRADRVDRARAALPRPARVGRCRRRASADARRDRHDEPRRLGRQGRGRARLVAAHLRRSAGSCSAVTSVADLIGYGTAVDYEGGGAAPALDNTTAAIRGGRRMHGHRRQPDRLRHAARRRRATPPAAIVPAASTPPPTGGVSQSAAVDIDIQPVLSIALERPTVSFGNATTGATPAPVSERVTVVSNNASGYAVTVRRTAFLPADLPLGIAGTAPSGGQIGGALAGGAMAAIPIAPAPDLLVGTTAAQSAVAGDVWDTRLGFVSPLPVVPAGRYAATVTFTVIGR